MQNTIKKIFILLIFLIIIGGIYFGIIFYRKLQPNNNINQTNTTNTNPNRTPFQTRVSTSTNNNNQNTENTDVENPENINAGDFVITKPRLFQVWKEPVSGFDFITKDIEIISTSTETSTSTNINKIANRGVLKNQDFIYFWDRKTGHIYENLPPTTDLNKISNYTLIGAQEVFFVDKENVISRFLKEDNETIETLYINLSNKSTSTDSVINNLKTSNIDINSNNISISYDSRRIFYFLKNTGRAILSSLDGNIKTNTLSTHLTEFLSQFVNRNTIGLTTKPSAYFKGYFFTLNTDGSGKNSYILGEKYGFNTLMSPDGNKIIYNEIINNVLETFIYDIRSKSNIYLSQATIVDKCTWSSDSKNIICGIPQSLAESPYPDSWYRNDISFSDNIWSIDSETGDFRLIVPLQDQIQEPFDVYQIKISKNNKHIIFQNKNDLTLWRYQIILD